MKEEYENGRELKQIVRLREMESEREKRIRMIGNIKHSVRNWQKG